MIGYTTRFFEQRLISILLLYIDDEEEFKNYWLFINNTDYADKDFNNTWKYLLRLRFFISLYKFSLSVKILNYVLNTFLESS